MRERSRRRSFCSVRRGCYYLDASYVLYHACIADCNNDRVRSICACNVYFLVDVLHQFYQRIVEEGREEKA